MISFLFPNGSRSVLIILTVFSFFLIFSYCGSTQAAVSDSVVKIYTVSNDPSYHNPWQMIGQISAGGSGCIIDGNLVLTNAHVVTNAMFIQVRRAGQSAKYAAVVKAIDYECDLALLSVEDKEFFEGVSGIPFGELARVRDKVAVYGFPEGGDKLSTTEGVVSRIDHIEYVYSGAKLLACQIDASINSGNSGGPVLFDDKIVGVAFQDMGGIYENIGYMIPVPIIKHFLDDIKDGLVDGFPTLGILMQKLENPDMRRYYRAKGKNDGILVNKVYKYSPSRNILQPGDIIMEIEGVKVASDGTILFRQGQRTFFGYLLNKKQVGDSLRVKIMRMGEEKDVIINLTVSQEANRLVPSEHEKIPRYYIYGGMVFQPLTLNYMQEFGGGLNWAAITPVAMLERYLNGEKTDKQEEVVFLSKTLADATNVGFHEFANIIISEVNGEKVSSFANFVKLIESNKRDYISFKTHDDLQIIMGVETVENNAHDILTKYHIAAGKNMAGNRSIITD